MNAEREESIRLTNSTCYRRALLVLRGFLGFGGNGGYFWTVTLLPLNDAIVLT